MKVTRRKERTPISGDPIVLRFTTGLVVQPSLCPRGIQAHGHWRKVDRIVAPGGVNTVCACVLEPDDAS